jgi:hypothetical protein
MKIQLLTHRQHTEYPLQSVSFDELIAVLRELYETRKYT